MKRFLLSLSFVICHLTFSVAQTGLRINDLFEGRIIQRERMVETRVRGRTLAKYQLTFYRSLRFSASTEEVARLRRIIDEDGRGHHATGTLYTADVRSSGLTFISGRNIRTRRSKRNLTG